MTPSAELLLTLAAVAAAWLSLRSDIRGLRDDLRKIEGEPERERLLEFERVLAAVHQAADDPIAKAREAQ